MKLTNEEELKSLRIGQAFQDYILDNFPPTIETQKAIFRISAAFGFAKRMDKIEFLKEMEEAYDFMNSCREIIQ